MSILKDNLTTKEEEDTYTAFHELENNDQYMIQRRLPMRPNICVICLTCLTCSGKYGSELCTCSPTEIHWNIKKEGYRVDFRRKSVSSSNENFLTWLRANRSARLMWSERYKEVKICMGCNSACWRWMKMYKGSNQTIQNSPSDMARVGSRLSTPFSSRPGIVEDEKPIIQPACVSRPESLPTSPKSPQRIHTDVKNELPVLHTQIPTTFTSPKSPLSAILNLTDSPESTRVPSPTQRAVVNSPRSSELNHEIVAKKSRRVLPAYIAEKEKDEETPVISSDTFMRPSKVEVSKTVTVRSSKTVYKDKIAISPTTTFESVLKYAIPIAAPEGKRFVMKSMDKKLEFVPDDFIAEAIQGVDHIEIYVYIENIPDIQLDDFDIA